MLVHSGAGRGHARRRQQDASVGLRLRQPRECFRSSSIDRRATRWRCGFRLALWIGPELKRSFLFLLHVRDGHRPAQEVAWHRDSGSIFASARGAPRLAPLASFAWFAWCSLKKGCHGLESCDNIRRQLGGRNGNPSAFPLSANWDNSENHAKSRFSAVDKTPGFDVCVGERSRLNTTGETPCIRQRLITSSGNRMSRSHFALL